MFLTNKLLYWDRFRILNKAIEQNDGEEEGDTKSDREAGLQGLCDPRAERRTASVGGTGLLVHRAADVTRRVLAAATCGLFLITVLETNMRYQSSDDSGR